MTVGEAAALRLSGVRRVYGEGSAERAALDGVSAEAVIAGLLDVAGFDHARAFLAQHEPLRPFREVIPDETRHRTRIVRCTRSE